MKETGRAPPPLPSRPSKSAPPSRVLLPGCHRSRGAGWGCWPVGRPLRRPGLSSGAGARTVRPGVSGVRGRRGERRPGLWTPASDFQAAGVRSALTWLPELKYTWGGGFTPAPRSSLLLRGEGEWCLDPTQAWPRRMRDPFAQGASHSGTLKQTGRSGHQLSPASGASARGGHTCGSLPVPKTTRCTEGTKRTPHSREPGHI